MTIFEYLKKNKKLLIISLIAFCAILYLLFSDYGIIKLISLKSEKNQLIEKIIIETNTIDSLKHTITELDTNKILIEKIAREKYGMVKPEETIIKVQKSKKEK